MLDEPQGVQDQMAVEDDVTMTMMTIMMIVGETGDAMARKVRSHSTSVESSLTRLQVIAAGTIHHLVPKVLHRAVVSLSANKLWKLLVLEALPAPQQAADAIDLGIGVGETETAEAIEAVVIPQALAHAHAIALDPSQLTSRRRFSRLSKLP